MRFLGALGWRPDPRVQVQLCPLLGCATGQDSRLSRCFWRGWDSISGAPCGSGSPSTPGGRDLPPLTVFGTPERRSHPQASPCFPHSQHPTPSWGGAPRLKQQEGALWWGVWPERMRGDGIHQGQRSGGMCLRLPSLCFMSSPSRPVPYIP